ncbi:hypothetical protein NMG60_11022467 [Bertholletia excelsa]
MMSLVGRPYAYSKMGKEDPEEMKHRKAQFLIYKVLEQADRSRRRPPFLKVRICRLKIKIGKKLKKLRKTVVLLSLPKSKVCFYKQVVLSQLKSWRQTLLSLPPAFT